MFKLFGQHFACVCPSRHSDDKIWVLYTCWTSIWRARWLLNRQWMGWWALMFSSQNAATTKLHEWSNIDEIWFFIHIILFLVESPYQASTYPFTGGVPLSAVGPYHSHSSQHVDTMVARNRTRKLQDLLTNCLKWKKKKLLLFYDQHSQDI